MTVVRNILRDLLRRHLWPVAVILIGGAVAAPVLLTTPADPVMTPAAPTLAIAGEAGPTAEALVALDADGAVESRVLGARKDPFRPTGKRPRKVIDLLKDAANGKTPGGGKDGEPKSSKGKGGKGDKGKGGGSDPAAKSPAPTPLAPTPPTPPAAKKPADSYEVYSLRVRFDGIARTLNRLDPLPDAENPAIIYLGLLEDGKTAVFLLDSSLEAQGDGSCHPSPQDCQRLYLKKGETEFFDVEGEDGVAGRQFQLDLIRIKSSKTASAGKARAAYSRVSTAGRRALRARMGRIGRLRFDHRTGKLRRLSKKGWRASLARAVTPLSRW